MNIEKLIDKMSKGVVLLEYTSLVSGNQKIREVTTNRDIIPEGQRVFTKDWRQGAEDNKLLCFDLEFGKWDDIEKDTIVKWKEIYCNSRYFKQIYCLIDQLISASSASLKPTMSGVKVPAGVTVFVTFCIYLLKVNVCLLKGIL